MLQLPCLLTSPSDSRQNSLGLTQCPLEACEAGEFDDSPRPHMYCAFADHVPPRTYSDPRRRRGRRGHRKTNKSEERGPCVVGGAKPNFTAVLPHSEQHARDLAPLDADLPARGPWLDGATTVMLRNIPNRYTAEELIAEMLAQGFDGGFDFFYLPVDFNTKRNKGYAFINFQHAGLAIDFRDAFDGIRLLRYSTQKILEVTPALTQGFDSNVNQYMRKDAQRITNPWFRPMIFEVAEAGPITGEGGR